MQARLASSEDLINILSQRESRRLPRAAFPSWMLAVLSKLYNPAPTLQALRYRVAAFRDDDVSPDEAAEVAFEGDSGSVFKWASGQKIEAAILKAANAELVVEILDSGKNFVGEDAANEHIKSVSNNNADFQSIRDNADKGQISTPEIDLLIKAATTKKNSWFKTVGRMEALARETVGPATEKNGLWLP